MKSIKGTRTEQNLLKSFAGESQARSRYTFFAEVARKEGYEQIAGVFMETAEQEREHAKRFFNFLEGGDLEITATYPAGKIGTRTFLLRRWARTRSGMCFTRSLLRSHLRRDSLQSQRLSRLWQRLRRSTSAVTSSFSAALQTEISSSATERSGGSAATAATSLRLRQRLRPALHASSHRLTSSL